MSLLSEIAQHLEPGEVLDDLVGRFVMKWAVTTRISERETPVPMWVSLSGDGSIASPVMPVSQWRPSTDSFQALRAMAALGNALSREGKGRFMGTDIRTTVPDHWEISLSENEMGPIDTVWAPTFPLVVARAAVACALWTEIEKEILARQKYDLDRGPVFPPPAWVTRAELAAPIVVPGKPVSQQIIEDRR